MNNSEARFEKWFKSNYNTKGFDYALAAWEAQEEFWSKRCAPLEEALKKIARFEEGKEVNGSFDEPCSARVARKAIDIIKKAEK
jgi:hypothetical protein